MCDYDGCDNEATHYDRMDDKICEDCMEREVEEGCADYEDFELI